MARFAFENALKSRSIPLRSAKVIPSPEEPPIPHRAREASDLVKVLESREVAKRIKRRIRALEGLAWRIEGAIERSKKVNKRLLKEYEQRQDVQTDTEKEKKDERDRQEGQTGGLEDEMGGEVEKKSVTSGLGGVGVIGRNNSSSSSSSSLSQAVIPAISIRGRRNSIVESNEIEDGSNNSSSTGVCGFDCRILKEWVVPCGFAWDIYEEKTSMQDRIREVYGDAYAEFVFSSDAASQKQRQLLRDDLNSGEAPWVDDGPLDVILETMCKEPEGGCVAHEDWQEMRLEEVELEIEEEVI
jgi:hypothetical protein